MERSPEFKILAEELAEAVLAYRRIPGVGPRPMISKTCAERTKIWDVVDKLVKLEEESRRRFVVYERSKNFRPWVVWDKKRDRGGYMGTFMYKDDAQKYADALEAVKEKV